MQCVTQILSIQSQFRGGLKMGQSFHDGLTLKTKRFKYKYLFYQNHVLPWLEFKNPARFNIDFFLTKIARIVAFHSC